MSWNEYSLDGIAHVDVTLKKNGTITAGTHEKLAAAIAANKEVAVGGANDEFCGQIIKIAGDDITVRVKGFITIGYTGTAPTLGWSNLECGASGAVQVDDTNGFPFLVWNVDTTNTEVTILL